MTIVEGQIGTLKQLKESLNRNGITRFNSTGEIKHFLRDYESEREQLLSSVESELEAEIQNMQSALISHQHSYEEQKTSIRNEVKYKIQNLELEIKHTSDKSNRNIFCKVFYFLKLRSLSRRKSSLENNLESTLEEKTKHAEDAVARLKDEINYCLENGAKIVTQRCKKPLDDLTHTKKVVDGLYTLVAGAIGESSVVKALEGLPDNCYLINDFSVEFDTPIYNRREDDRIFSIQIDHLLVCQSGVFLLETKNWSKASVENLDLRSPVKQIRRNSFALFVLLNSDSTLNDIRLERHHWGDRKIPIRNIIVMTNEKPKEQFKHVKVLSLNQLIGYIRYFDQTFNGEEVQGIFEYLKTRM